MGVAHCPSAAASQRPLCVALTLSSPRMTIPTYDQFIEPILRFLARHPDGVPAKVAHDAAANELGLSPDEKAQLLTSGAQQVYKNRAGWAHDRLKRAGLSSSPKRGHWKLTPAGIKFVDQHTDPIPADVLQRLAMEFIDVKLKSTAGPDASATPTPIPPAHAPIVSPDDQLEEAVAELRAAAAAELLEVLAAVSPAFFERVVLDLLPGVRHQPL